MLPHSFSRRRPHMPAVTAAAAAALALCGCAAVGTGAGADGFLCAGETPSPGCFRRSDTTMRSENPHPLPMPPASRMAKDEGHGKGKYNTAEAVKAFRLNRLDWVYTDNATWVKESLASGLRAISLSINANLPDRAVQRSEHTHTHRCAPATATATNVGGGSGCRGGADRAFATAGATYTVGRMLNVDLQPVAAPWMRTWDPVPYRGCVNNPDYRAIVSATVRDVAAAGPSAIQHDDYSTNEGGVAYGGGDPHQSGCYCSHCTSGFTQALTEGGALDPATRAKWNVTSSFDYRAYLLGVPKPTPPSPAAGKRDALRELFVSFQSNSTRAYFRWLRSLLATAAPGGLALGCNNGGEWPPTAVLACDYGMGELPKRAANPGGLETIFRDAVPPGRQQVMTMPKEANETPFDAVNLTRFTFATAYALGANMLGPWDVYLPAPSAPRFWGDADDYDDLFGFVRDNSWLLDGASEAVANTPPVNASFELAHTGAGGDGQRFNLPSDTAHPSKGFCVKSATAEACEYQCLADSACVAVYTDRPNECCLLHRPLTVIRGTALKGDSYLRRNCSFEPAGCGGKPAPFQCVGDCANVSLSLYPRRGACPDTKQPFVAIHLVRYDSGPEWAEARVRQLHQEASLSPAVVGTALASAAATVTLSLSNAALFGGGNCDGFELRLMAPNRSSKALSPTCRGNGTSEVTVPTPTPWAVVVATPSS